MKHVSVMIEAKKVACGNTLLIVEKIVEIARSLRECDPFLSGAIWCVTLEDVS
jgi:hypothetical protein